MFTRVTGIVKRIETTGERGDQTEADGDHEANRTENQNDANDKDEELF